MPETDSEGMDVTALLKHTEPGLSSSAVFLLVTLMVKRGYPRPLVLKRVFLFHPEGANRRKNLPPKVPITPMPRYSIMETPVLKKELDRLVVFLNACLFVLPFVL